MGTLPNCIIRSMYGNPVPESGKFGTRKKVCRWKPKFWALRSGMQLKESGIPLTNPESKFHTNWNPVCGIRNPGSGIQNSRMSLIPLHRTTLFYWEGGRSRGEERAGRGISSTTGSGREIQNGKLSFFCYCLSSSQRNEPNNFHLTFSEA